MEIVRTLLRTHALPEALYTQALAELGRQQLIETIALAGYYSLIGLTVNASMSHHRIRVRQSEPRASFNITRHVPVALGRSKLSTRL